MKIMFNGCIYESIENVPSILYHGSNVSFDKFTKMSGSVSTIFGNEVVDRHGYFFTDNPEFAKEFGSIVLKCQLDMRNTLDMDYGVTNEEDIDLLERNGLSRRFLSNLQPSGVWEIFDGDSYITDVIKASGFDSVKMKEPNKDNRLERVYVVFSPEQIRVVGQL